MKIEIIGTMTVQSADAGKVLTNGESISEKVYLPKGAGLWDEIVKPDEELTDTEALNILTGKENV